MSKKKHQKTREMVPDKTIDLNDPSLYINRELSWLQFNRRVLEEALDERHPIIQSKIRDAISMNGWTCQHFVGFN